jgi:hypothetical protein
MYLTNDDEYKSGKEIIDEIGENGEILIKKAFLYYENKKL